MNAILLYRSSSKLSPQHHPVIVGDNDKILYIRAERVTAADLSAALDLAKPREGEKFINSIPADE
jgi:hypothetical protein